MNQLVDTKLVANSADIYNLNVEQLANLERMAEKSAKNVIDAIAASKNRPLWRLLHGLGIPHVGEGAARKLADHFRSFERLQNATTEQLTHVQDIGDIMAEAIAQYFQNRKNLDVIRALSEAGLRMEDEAANETADVNHPLFGKTVVVTGTLAHFSRDEIKEALRRVGAVVTDSVSKKTHYLIAGEAAGSKLEKARKFNVTVLTEAETESLLND